MNQPSKDNETLHKINLKYITGFVICWVRFFVKDDGYVIVL
jgi:hypothetical protein